MPLYEYRCRRCGSTFEVLQRAGEAPPGKCPECGGPVTKLLSPPAIQFKGGGWYVTDYAKKPAKAADPKPGAEADKPPAGTKGPDKPKPSDKPPAASSD